MNQKTGYGTAAEDYAHRLAWERERGPIPDGLTVDHVGHDFAGRRCVNVRETVRSRTAGHGNSARRSGSVTDVTVGLTGREITF